MRNLKRDLESGAHDKRSDSVTLQVSGRDADSLSARANAQGMSRPFLKKQPEYLDNRGLKATVEVVNE